MKKLSLFLLVFTSTFTTLLFGQGGNPGNLRVAGAFLGWNAGAAGPLEIRNDFLGAGQPIDFYTYGAPRMTILGQAGATQGFVGIGTATPISNLSVDGAALATGEVFRTDCATGDSPFLRFLRGGSEFGTLWNTAVTIPFYAGGVANGQAYIPDDFIA